MNVVTHTAAFVSQKTCSRFYKNDVEVHLNWIRIRLIDVNDEQNVSNCSLERMAWEKKNDVSQKPMYYIQCM